MKQTTSSIILFMEISFAPRNSWTLLHELNEKIFSIMSNEIEIQQKREIFTWCKSAMNFCNRNEKSTYILNWAKRPAPSEINSPTTQLIVSSFSFNFSDTISIAL